MNGGLDALAVGSYNVTVTIRDVDALYTSPGKTFIINVRASCRQSRSPQIRFVPSGCQIDPINFTIGEDYQPGSRIGPIVARERGGVFLLRCLLMCSWTCRGERLRQHHRRVHGAV